MDPITLGTECDLHERPVESIRQPSPTRAVQAPILLPRRVPSIDQPGRPLAEATREPHRHRLGASEVAPPGLGVRVLRNDHQAAAVPRVLHREDILPPAKSPGVPQLDGGAAQQAVRWRPQHSQHNGVSLRPLHTTTRLESGRTPITTSRSSIRCMATVNRVARGNSEGGAVGAAGPSHGMSALAAVCARAAKVAGCVRPGWSCA